MRAVSYMAPTIPSKTLVHLEWSKVLERLSTYCRGPVAHAAALALDFPADGETLRRRLARTDEARRLLDAGRTVPLGEVPDVRAVARLAARGGVLEPDALGAIGVALETAARCARALEELRSAAPELARIGDQLPNRLDVARQLLSSIDERGQVADSASGDLGHLRLRVAQLHEQLKHRITGLVSDPQYTGMLQDEYYTLREDRYVLPIRSGHKNHVPGIVHGWSQTGHTVYIEPQAIVEANNALRFAQADVEREVTRILTRLSALVGEVATDIGSAVEHLATLDLSLACGALSKALEGTAPTVDEGGELRLNRARHALLVLDGVRVVPNDLVLGGGQRALVITGPNTGGKTVALKTAGLCTLLALAGLHVPCEAGSRVPRVPGVFTDIGDEQSLQAHLSTFSGHIVNVKGMLEVLLPGALVLLDELVVGTDPVQGAALAQAILETLVSRGAFAIVTTHYESLKALPYADPRFRNGAMGIDPDRATPTYLLRLDLPGTSSALGTARRLGLEPEIVDRAEALAGQQHSNLERVLERLERDAEAARQERVTLESERRALERARHDAEQHEKTLRERLKTGLDRERTAALDEARKLRDEVRALKRALQAPEQRKDVRVLEASKGRAEQVISTLVAQQAAATKAQAGAAPSPAQLTPGTRVYVLSLGCDAELLRAPDERGRTEVRAGALTIKIDASDLRLAGPKGARLPEPAPRKEAPAGKVAVGFADATPQGVHNTLDVRGMRADEAIAATERFLDAQIERDGDVAYVIHGHGTGALKKELRRWLETSPYVRASRPAEQHQGGDGVTAVLLS